MMITHLLLKIVNFFIPKKKSAYYFEPLRNCKSDCYDLLNFNGDTLLSFLRFFLEKQQGKIDIYLVVYHESRIPLYKAFASKFKNTSFHFLLDERSVSKKKTICKIRKLFSMFKCKYLFYEPVLISKPYFVKRQRKISLGYFSTFKSDFGEADLSKTYKKWDLICTTSKLDSIMKSAAYGVPFEFFKNLGLCRNDHLFSCESKKDAIYEWLNQKGINTKPKIILYAPTYRDHVLDETKSIWGFDVDKDIDEYLKKNNYVVIAKMHSRQNVGGFLRNSERTLFYEPSFEFTFYDLMKQSVLLISDYSSIVLDYQLLDKPIVFNLYDLEEYSSIRGFAFEPFEFCCGGEIVTRGEDLIKSIDNAIVFDPYKAKRDMVRRIAFDPCDGKSCQRVFDSLEKLG